MHYFRNKNTPSYRSPLLSVFCFLCCFCSSLESQTYAFQYYTVEDGLPSSFLYDIAQDKEGYLWISTEEGLCKFDGHRFLLSPISEVTKDEIVDIVIDSKNRLWMTSISTAVWCYDHGKIYSFDPLDDTESYYYLSTYEDNLGNMWFLHKAGVSVIKEKNDKLELMKLDLPSGKGGSIFLPSDSDTIHIYNRNVLTSIYDYKIVDKTSLLQDTGNRHIRGSVKYKDEVLIADDEMIYSYSFKTNKLTERFGEFNAFFKPHITYIYVDKKDRLWISTRDGLLLIQENENGESSLQQFLKGVVAGVIMEDDDGTYWITTQHKGLTSLPATNLGVFLDETKNNHVTAVITNSKGEIVIGFNNNWLNILDKNGTIISSQKVNKSNQYIYDLLLDEDEKICVFGSSGFQGIDNDLQLKNESFKVARFGEDNTIWVGSGQTASLFDGKDYSILLWRRTYAVYPLGKREAFLGTIDGLYHYKNGNVELTKDSLLQQDIRDIEQDETGAFWFVTQGNGVFVYKEGKIIKHFTKNNGLASNKIKKIVLTKDYAWVASNQGIDRIAFSNDEIKNINNDYGLPSNEVNYLHTNNNKIYAGTSNGLVVFDTDLPFQYSLPSLQFTSIKIAERDTVIQSDYKLAHNDNNIKIQFTGIIYKHEESVRYKYQMEGVDEDWIETDLNLAQYPSLRTGEYKFKVKARTKYSEWTEEKVIHFEIEKAYYETWSFYAILFLTFLLLGAFMTWRIIQYNNKQVLIQKKIKESQLTALRAQMNPHFMFNALNSIQEFIIQEDKRSANRYLSKFSMLMRNILNMSDKNEISLDTEIKSLKLYLSLEALRFEDNFEYEIEIGEVIDTEQSYIPSMLIQPYVENAIKHGLLHKKGLRKLHISFDKKEDTLICEVDDNGIGRKKSKQIQENNVKVYESKAMSLTKERLELLNSTRKDKLGVNIVDKVNERGNAMGTKVILHINLK